MTQTLELEQQLIAAAFLQSDLLTSPVAPADFSDQELGEAWTVARKLHAKGEPADAVTVGSVMGGDAVYTLGRIQQEYGHSSANGDFAARVVKEKGLERRAAAIATDFAAGNIDKTALINKLRDLDMERSLPAAHAYSVIGDLVDYMDSPPEALPTGIGRFDEKFSGLHRQDLVTVLARPAVGKTAMAITMARSMVQAGMNVLFYSGEMDSRSILSRFIAQEAGIPAYKFRSGKLDEKQWRKFNDAAARMKDLNLFIADPPVPMLVDLQGITQKINETRGLDVVFIDYMQRLQSPKKESFRLEMVATAKAVKSLAREHDACVVALSQAKREVDNYDLKTYGQLPHMGDSAESAQIEMESDMILTLARNGEQAAVSVEKNRNGPCGMVMLEFDGPTMRFSGAPTLHINRATA